MIVKRGRRKWPQTYSKGIDTEGRETINIALASGTAICRAVHPDTSGKRRRKMPTFLVK